MESGDHAIEAVDQAAPEGWIRRCVCEGRSGILVFGDFFDERISSEVLEYTP